MDKPGAYSMTPRFTTSASSSVTPNQRNMLSRMNSRDSMEIALKLSEQDAQYGTNMHDSLTAADEPEIEKLTRNGFAEHEALLEIFNRKFVRDYVPQHFKRNDAPVSRSAPPSTRNAPPPAQRGVVRNNRYSKQWAIDHMNQYDVVQLTLLLSEQEAAHGVNMYDAMTYEDEMEVDALVRSGRFIADQAIRHVFDRNYPPRNGGGSGGGGGGHHHQPIHRTTSAYSAPLPRRDPYPPPQHLQPPPQSYVRHGSGGGGGHEYVPAPYDYPGPAVGYDRRSPAPSPRDPYYPPPAQQQQQQHEYAFPTTYAPAPSPHGHHQPLHHHTQSFYREPVHYAAPPPMVDPYYPPAVPSPVGYAPLPIQQPHRLVAAPSIVNIQQQQFEELQRAANGGGGSSDERRRLEEDRRRLEEDRRRFEEERRRVIVSDVHNRMGARDPSPQPRDRLYGNGSVRGNGSIAGGSVHGGSVHGGSVRSPSPTPSTGSAATGISGARRRTSFTDGGSVNGDSGSVSSRPLEKKKSIFSFLSTASNNGNGNSSNASSPASGKSMTYREKDVKQVMELGYSREFAVAALIEANNDPKAAIQLLANR